MAKGIYVGAAETQKNDIIPKNWSEVTKGTEYKADDGTILTAKNYNIGYADKACDGNENTYWQSSTGTAGKTGWLELNLSENKKISGMMVKLSSTSTAASVDFTITVMGKLTDDSSWVTLNTLNTTVPNNSQPSYTLELSNLDFYKYYRLNLSASDNSIRIYEWQAYEYVIKPGIARKVKKAYVGVSEDSLVANGDFSEGLNGWTHSDSTNSNIVYTIENGWLVATCNTSYSDNTSFDVLSQLTNWQTNHQYYCRYTGKVLSYVENADASTTLGVHFSSGNIQSNLDLRKLNEEQTISRISTWTSDTMDRKTTTALRKVEAGTKVAFTGIGVYDLTILYGSGNEPTKEWCDNNLETLKKLYKSQNGKARKVKKGYIGVGGVARLFYEAPITFSSNPAPTSWTLSSNKNIATATNTYGTWQIETDVGGYSTTDYVYEAFDGNTSTYYRTYEAATTGELYFALTLPAGMSINPESIYVQYSYFGSIKKVQGYNVATSAWEDIAELSTSSTSSTQQTLSIKTDNYYSAFRVAASRYSSSTNQKHVRLYEFQLKEGTIKIG